MVNYSLFKSQRTNRPLDDDIDAVARDYTRCVTLLGPYADILVVNVSSPNTAGLRALQAFEPLAKILSAVTDASRSLHLRKYNPPKVMVKISPDEDSDAQINGICHAIFEAGVNGVIVGNTTKSRPSPDSIHPGLTTQEAASMAEQGRLLGAMDVSTDIIPGEAISENP